MNIKVTTKQTISQQGRTFTNLVLMVGSTEYPIQVVYGNTPNKPKTQALIELIKCLQACDEGNE